MANIRKSVKKSGLPPGSLVYTGKKDLETKITVFEFDKDTFNKKIINKCPEFENKETIKWVKINGFSNIELLKEIAACFNLHSLVLEDILNTHQQPKIEDYNDYLYFVLKLFELNEEERVKTKQISLILQKNLVITFQDDEDNILDVIINRLRTKDSKIRNKGADYLLYSLIDVIIDKYFLDLEKLEVKIELIEEDLIEHPEQNVLKRIHNIKLDIITFRKTIWPIREMVSSLGSQEYFLIDRSTDYYFRDVYDHIIQIFDDIQSLRDRISEMLDIYLSSTSNKLNEIVRVLTVISTIFVPLTFIVGLYGMNFQYMPELRHPLGYPGVLSLMLIISISMLIYFRRKNWI